MSESRPQPLFRWDPGWLFLLAGLAVLAASTIVPAQRDAAELETQHRELQAKEQFCCQRLAAYASFLEQWDRPTPELLERLASSQLNRRPSGDRPVILASHVSSAVTDWIDASVQYQQPPTSTQVESMLARLTTGRGQLWMLAAGTMAVFVGLLLGPSTTDRAMLRATATCEDEDEMIVLSVDRAHRAVEHVEAPVEPMAAACTAVIADDVSRDDDDRALSINAMDVMAPHEPDPDNVEDVQTAVVEHEHSDVIDESEPDANEQVAIVDLPAIDVDADAEDDHGMDVDDDADVIDDADASVDEDDEEWEDGDEDEEWEDEDEEDEDYDEEDDDYEDDEEGEDEEWEDDDEEDDEEEDDVEDDEDEADEDDEEWEADENDVDEDDEEWEDEDDDDDDDDDLFMDEEEEVEEDDDER